MTSMKNPIKVFRLGGDVRWLVNHGMLLCGGFCSYMYTPPYGESAQASARPLRPTGTVRWFLLKLTLCCADGVGLPILHADDSTKCVWDRIFHLNA